MCNFWEVILFKISNVSPVLLSDLFSFKAVTLSFLSLEFCWSWDVLA